jgi:hypothetical protein
MPRELEPWGGDVRLPRWIARLLHRKPDTTDTPERAHERHKPEYSDRTVLENVDRAAMFGAYTQADKHPHGNDPD